MSSPTTKDDKAIRGQLLYRLGIYDTTAAPADLHNNGPKTANISSTHHHSNPMSAAEQRRHRILRGMGVGSILQRPSPPDGSATRNPLGQYGPVKEPLKVDDGHHRPITTEHKSKKKTTKIGFSEDVEVVQIPTRYEYSDRIKSRIWSNRHELQENAERNAVEFASEGWNWRNVTEDDGMYICSQSGELVHPIHLQHLVQQQQQQEPQHEEEEAAVIEKTTTPIMDDNDEEKTTTASGGTTSNALERGAPVHSN